MTSVLDASALLAYLHAEAGAERVAAWRLPTKALGLSLSDRCCLALAHRLGMPALTADRDWQRAGLPVAAVLIR